MGNIAATKIIFMGTPDFAVPSLQALMNNYQVVAVVTNPGDPPVKKVAEEKKLLIFQPENLKDPTFIKSLENLKPDLIVVAAYGRILPKEILDIPIFGSINIHASLLPRWRGASPIQYAILNGDKKTGITIIKMTEKVDQGPILSQKESLIEEKDTNQTLGDKLAKLGTELLIETIKNYLDQKVMPKEQNELEAIYTKILTKEDGRIIWSKKADEIERQIRAFDPWPGSFTFFQRNDQLLRIKILKTELGKESDEVKQAPFGQVFLKERQNLAVKTGAGLIIIDELQLEGGRILKTGEFLAGYPEIIGQILA